MASRRPTAAARPSCFSASASFPIANDPEFALSEEARRVYRSGAPFLQRYVPFWVATMVDRLLVSLVVLVPILIPLVRFAPQIYSWRIRRRIMYWYGELKSLEAAGKARRARGERAAKLRSSTASRRRSDNIPVPLGFSDRLYDLRLHIEGASPPPPDGRHGASGYLQPPRLTLAGCSAAVAVVQQREEVVLQLFGVGLMKPALAMYSA